MIGEGSDFLTVQVEVPSPVAPTAQLQGLILDAAGQPVRKVTGFPALPHDPQGGRFWIFFCLYAPGELPRHLRESRHIRFQLSDEALRREQTVSYSKTWGSDGGAQISDLPAPPDEIVGRLVLSDYTFLAEGDLRQVEGYYVDCKIVGHGGRWDHLEVLSDIQGRETPPELRLAVDRGWLELATGRSHSMREAVAPARPYVDGWWDGKGLFHPDPARIR